VTARQEKPLILLSGSFLLCFVGVSVFFTCLPSAETWFSGMAWRPFACGAFAGMALGMKWMIVPPRLRSLFFRGAMVLLFFSLLNPAYRLAALIDSPSDAVLFAILAIPPLPVFFWLGRLFAPFARGAGPAWGHCVTGGLAGAAAARFFVVFCLEGSVGAPVVVSAAVAGVVALAWILPRLMGNSLSLLPAGVRGGHSVLDVAERLDGPGRGFFQLRPEVMRSATGSFLLGAALSSLYPVARKVLGQVAPNLQGAELTLFGICLGGAVLGALFLTVCFPAGRVRSGVALLGAVAFAYSLFVLAGEFAFTQEMNRFRGFRRAIFHLHETYIPLLDREIPLCLAFAGLPAFTAGMALGSLRGAWRSFLLGLAGGCLAGSGLFSWTGASSRFVLQSSCLAAAAALVFSLRAFLRGGRGFFLSMKVVTLLAALGAGLLLFRGSAGVEDSDYPDLPLAGEVELLHFEATPGEDVRVTADGHGAVRVRLGARYAYYRRDLDTVGRLVARFPRVFGARGRCLVVGPLAPVVAPVVEEAVAGGAEASGGALSVKALETLACLEGASRALADSGGRPFIPCADDFRGRTASFLLDHTDRFDQIVFLPSFPGAEGARGMLSREIFGLAHDALAEKGFFWLYLDTAGFSARAAGAAFSAVAETFDVASCWIVEEGLAPPFLLCLGIKGDARLDAARLERGVEGLIAEYGPASAPFRGVSDLCEYLIAGPGEMKTLRTRFGTASAWFPVYAGMPCCAPPGWRAVRDLAEVLPSSDIGSICGRDAPDRAARHKARRLVLEGLAIHGGYKYRIAGDDDLDWASFHEEVGLYGAACRLCPEAALAGKTVAALLPMLLNAKEFQTAYEMVRDTAGLATPDFTLRCRLGIISFELLDLEDALEHFRFVLEGDPCFGEALLYAGRTALALGRHDEAAGFCERGIAAEPDGEGFGALQSEIWAARDEAASPTGQEEQEKE
jgi:hypothetical protein